MYAVLNYRETKNIRESFKAYINSHYTHTFKIFFKKYLCNHPMHDTETQSPRQGR